MADYIVKDTELTSIADAIRGKTGKTDGLTLEQMPGEIEAIQTGGDTSNEDGLITRTLTTYSNDRVTTIGVNAFAGFTTLGEVSLPNIINIGGGAFLNCKSLKKVSFPKVTNFGNEVFYNCTSIESITNSDFPALTNIGGDYSFRNCSSLKYFQCNHTKFAYSNRTFYGCRALEKADINASILAMNTFSGCDLTALILRNSDVVTSLNAATAANLGNPIYNGTGYVYVPRTMDDGSDGVAAYRAATNWSSLLPEQFRAIEDYPEICEVGV